MKDFIPIFPARVEKGKLVFEDRVAFQIWLEGLEGEVEVVVRKKKKRRTANQNNFWHGVWLPIIAQSTGNLDIEEVCEPLRGKFLGYETKTLFGEIRSIPKSTADLGKNDMTDFLEKVKMFCENELNIFLPEVGGRFVLSGEKYNW